MKLRDIVIGLIILASLTAAIYWLRKTRQPLEIPTPTVEEEIEESFMLTIPEDVEKAILSDVTGGDATGLATRDFEAGLFTHMVLADLPDPETASFYEGWLVMGDNFISTGKMRVAKGGFLLEFQSAIDYSDYDKVVITQEKILDKTPEKHILEGSF